MLETVLILAAAVAGVTGAWSPCGFSMVETLAPHGYAGRLRTTLAACATFSVGALVGGAATFGGLALLGQALGAGGPVGTGRQYWPWIHLQDWVDLARFIIQTPAAAGALNATAPAPVTNAEFAAALGRVLGRPAFLRAPGFALKVVLGEMAGPLLLSGQRAVPARAEALGVTFSYRTLEEALRAIFNR